MATNLNVVRTVTIQAKPEGFAETTASLKGLDTALQGVAKSGNVVATATETQRTSQLSMADAFARNERNLVSGVRAQQQYDKILRETNIAVGLNPALQERANAVLAAAAAKYGQASAASQIFSDVTKGLSGQLIAMSAGFGPIGVALAAIPGWGLAAAAGLGVLTAAFNAVDGAATKLAEKAFAIHTFSVSTGFSTAEVQALRIEAGKFGNSTEEIETALRRFAASFEEIRTHSGAAYEALQKYVPLYAKEISQAESYGEALTLVAKAQSQLPQGQKLQLDTALFGKGGRGITEFISSLDVSEITNKLSSAGRVLDSEFIKKMRQVSIDIAETEKQISENVGKIFALPYLEQRLAAIREFRDLLVGIKGLASDVGSAVSHFTPGVGTTTQLPLNVGANRNISDRDMANQEGPTPLSAITKGAPAIDKLPAPDMTATINDMKAVISILGDAATATDHYNLRILELNKALADGKISTDIYNRAIESAGGALTQADIAFQVSIQSIRARTAAEREAAAASAASASTPGGSAERELAANRAVTMEVEKQKQAHADAMVQMSGELALARARTGAEKMVAQEAANYVQLVRQGRTETQAAAEASAQRAVAEANVNTQVANQTKSLNEQTELTRARMADQAQMNGDASVFTNQIEAATTAQQSYNEAIRQGADETEAMGLKLATLASFAAKAAEAAQRIAIAESKAAQAGGGGWGSAGGSFSGPDMGEGKLWEGQRVGAGAVGGLISSIESVTAAANKLGVFLSRPPTQILGLGGTTNNGLALWMQEAQKDIAQAQKDLSAKDQLQSLIDQGQLIGKSDAEKAQIESQQTYNNLIKEGVNATLAGQIAAQQLANGMADLKNSVDANTAAVQATLDPIYTQGHSALKIGYYGEGSGGTAKTVTGTGWGGDAPSNSNVSTSPYAGNPFGTTNPNPVTPGGTQPNPNGWPLGITQPGVNPGGTPHLYNPSQGAPNVGDYTPYGPSPGPGWYFHGLGLSGIWEYGVPPDPNASQNLAEGGVIPPYGAAIVGEHSPMGPQFFRAGSEPVMVTPNVPSNKERDRPSVTNVIQNITFNVPPRTDLGERQTRRALFENAGRSLARAS